MAVGEVIIKESAKAVANLVKGWLFFQQNEVVVGVTEETAGRGGPYNNAELAYLHTNGCPAQHIPARPFLEPALAQEGVKHNIGVMLKDAANEVLVHGNEEGCKQLWEKAGMMGRDAVKSYMAGGVPPPNAPSTVAMKGSSTPLIDTGALLSSITYAVRRKK